MRILGIDPGPSETAIVILDTETMAIERKGMLPSEFIFVDPIQPLFGADVCVIEVMVSAFVNPRKGKGYIGQETMKTQLVAGQIGGWWLGTMQRIGYTYLLGSLHRKQIVAHLCGSAQAGNSDVRTALIERFPATGQDGKGRPSAIGTKKAPGPLYGIREDLWSALAVAVTWADLHKETA